MPTCCFMETIESNRTTRLNYDYYLLLAYSPVNRSGSPQGFSQVQISHMHITIPELIKILTICQRIWDSKQWPKEWTQSLIIPLPKKGNLKLCQNYRTLSLISHPSKVMLRVLLNRIKGKAEETITEEQAGFRPKSTTEHIFNIRLLI